MKRLCATLRAAGWREDGEFVVAKNGSMWFRDDDGWPQDLGVFLEQMEGRRQRLLRHEDAEGVADVESVIATVRELLRVDAIVAETDRTE